VKLLEKYKRLELLRRRLKKMLYVSRGHNSREHNYREGQQKPPPRLRKSKQRRGRLRHGLNALKQIKLQQPLLLTGLRPMLQPLKKLLEKPLLLQPLKEKLF